MTSAEPGPEIPDAGPPEGPPEVPADVGTGDAPPLTKPPLLRRPMFLYWVLVIVLVIVMLTIGALNRHSKSHHGSASSTAKHGVSTRPSHDAGPATTPPTAPIAAPTTTSTTAPATTTTTVPPAQGSASVPQTLQSQNGTGSQALSPFTVPASDKGWLIHYLFNCASLGSMGNLRIDVQSTSGSTVDTAANLEGVNGGSTYYNDTPGTYRLQIYTACDWAAVVQTIPQ